MSPTRPENLTQPYNFYREHSQKFIFFLMIAILIMLGMAGFVMYQITHRPLPPYTAVAENGKQMILVSHDEPNYLSTSLIRWANKAAVAAYTFDFANHDKQLATARPYFTEAGWADYQRSISGLIQTIVQNQLFVNGVVSGVPVISSQGDFGHGYEWHIQMPFLVTYQSAETTSQKNYMVMLTIVKVPTQENPTGIGIDQFVMS